MFSKNGKFRWIFGKFEVFDPQKGCFLRLFLMYDDTKCNFETRKLNHFIRWLKPNGN